MNIREIPFLPLGGVFEQDDVDAATHVLEAAAKPRGSFFPLPEENDFQSAFARHEGVPRAVAVNSCGTALDVCMQVLDIRPGDEVITTPLTFVCTAGSPAARGARIIFADVDERTLNLDPNRVRDKITERTKAIIPVHFAGHPVDIDAFSRISDEHHIPIIYDAAHAVGARYHEQPIGAFGTASCYSFQSNKNMTCTGEGGMITTDSDDFAERARQKKTFGYVYGSTLRIPTIGFNYRMTKLQCAVGLTQLAKIDRVISERLDRFQKLSALIEDCDELRLPAGIEPGHACHLYVLRLNTDVVRFTRDEFAAHLRDRYKIGTSIHYPIVWSWDAFREIEHDASNCAVADKSAREVLSMPLFPSTGEEDVVYIAWALKQAIVDLTH